MRIPGPGVSFPLCSMLLACGAVNAKLIDEDGGIVINSASELEEACEELEIAGEEVFEVVFEAATTGCDWGASGNLEAAQGILTARTEAVENLELGSGELACDLDFEFTDISGEFDLGVYHLDRCSCPSVEYRGVQQCFFLGIGLGIYK